MSTIHAPSSLHVYGRAPTALALACVLVLAIAPAAAGATSTNAWLAKVGSAGANGTATIQAYTTGTGSLVLKLKKLPTARTLAVTLLKTSCKGSTLLTLASIRSSSTGAATRTSSLTAAQVTSIKKATTGTGKIAIRIGTGTTAKCGVFVVQTVPAYVAAKVTVGHIPSGIAIDATGVWVTNWWDNTLSRIDPATNQVLNTIPVALTGNAGPEAITSGAGSLWVSTSEYNDASEALPGTILRIDPVTGAVLATIPGGRDMVDMVFGLGAVWVVNYDDSIVRRIDPATNQAITISVPFPLGITVDAANAWVVSGNGNVSKIDPATNQVVATILTQVTGGYVAVGAGSIWVSNPGFRGTANGSISRIDPATNLVIANIPVGDFPADLSFAGGSVWVGMLGEPSLIRINPATNAPSKLYLSAPVFKLAATDHAVWAVHYTFVSEGMVVPPDGAVTHVGY